MFILLLNFILYVINRLDTLMGYLCLILFIEKIENFFIS